MRRVTILAGAVGLALALLGSGAVWSARAEKESFCSDYANRSVEQHRQNRQQGCEFRGTLWSYDWGDHFSWCLSQPRRRASQHLRYRQDRLTRCSRDDRAFCRRYSRRAIGQQHQNLRRRCGFRGPRWHTKFDDHYNWCKRASRRDAWQEERRRQADLRHCRGEDYGDYNKCAEYAARAMRQQRRNLRQGCGYVGRRWHDNYVLHYDYCREVGWFEAIRDSELRDMALRRCRRER